MKTRPMFYVYLVATVLLWCCTVGLDFFFPY